MSKYIYDHTLNKIILVSEATNSPIIVSEIVESNIYSAESQKSLNQPVVLSIDEQLQKKFNKQLDALNKEKLIRGATESALLKKQKVLKPKIKTKQNLDRRLVKVNAQSSFTNFSSSINVQQNEERINKIRQHLLSFVPKNLDIVAPYIKNLQNKYQIYSEYNLKSNFLVRKTIKDLAQNTKYSREIQKINKSSNILTVCDEFQKFQTKFMIDNNISIYDDQKSIFPPNKLPLNLVTDTSIDNLDLSLRNRKKYTLRHKKNEDKSKNVDEIPVEQKQTKNDNEKTQKSFVSGPILSTLDNERFAIQNPEKPILEPTTALKENWEKFLKSDQPIQDKFLTDDQRNENLSPLNYLNTIVDTSFLIENKKPSSFGVNINIDFENFDDFPDNYPYGLGFKPIRFISEIFYDPIQKIYDFKNREVDDQNRNYPNIKFMLKLMFKKEINEEAQKLAKEISEKIWFNQFFYTLHIAPMILNYLSEQTIFWKNLYNDEYDRRKAIEEEQIKLELDKQATKQLLYGHLDDIKADLILDIKKCVKDENLRNYLYEKIDKKTKKILLMKDKYKLNYLLNVCEKIKEEASNLDIMKKTKTTLYEYDSNQNSSKYSFLEYSQKIDSLIENNITKWFGFQVNLNLAKLFYLCDLDLSLLNYNSDMDLDRKHKKYILINLVQLCKKTNSKQILYYLNIWAVDKERKKGFDEFLRTFNYWFNFGKNFEKKKNLYTDCCNILMCVLNVRFILIKNTNKILNLKQIYDDENHEKEIMEKNLKNQALQKQEEERIVNKAIFDAELNKNLTKLLEDLKSNPKQTLPVYEHKTMPIFHNKQNQDYLSDDDFDDSLYM